MFRTWKSKQQQINTAPTKDKIENFWSSIWEKETSFRKEAPWIKTLENGYCRDTRSKNYFITQQIFESVLKKIKNNVAHGNDCIRSYWIKRLTSTLPYLLTELNTIYEEELMLPDWLTASKTIPLPKNNLMHETKNYRPRACQSTIYKIYTGIINNFLEDHCSINDVITLEQAGGKESSWGCADQLLNKIILEQVRNNHRNLLMMWFDYKKAFDSVPHDWIIKALQLAKVPPKIINAISQLMKVWATKITLKGESKVTETHVINYLTGVLQGDCLSLLLFILSVNPLLFLLKNLPGYKIGEPGKRGMSISHLFFVNDLKTYASDKKDAKLQLGLISQFLRDISIQFGSD